MKIGQVEDVVIWRKIQYVSRLVPYQDPKVI